MNAIFERTSVRVYSKKPVKKKELKQLLKAGMAAPSAGNQQPWEFIVVTDDNQRKILSSYSPYSKPVARAPLSIILLMRTTGLRFPALAQQDMAACAENILLQATRLGLGSVWQCVYPEPERMSYISDMFDLPETVVPFAVISIGRPKKGKLPKQQDRYDKKRISFGSYTPSPIPKVEPVAPLPGQASEQAEAPESIAKADAAAGSDAAAEADLVAAPADEQPQVEKPVLTGWHSASNAAS